MKIKIIIGTAVLIWGIVYLISFWSMLIEFGFFDIGTVRDRLGIFKDTVVGAISGNTSDNQILFLSLIISIALLATIAVTLMIIGASLIWSRFRLPQIPVAILIGFVIFLFIRIWTTIKHADPGSAFDSLFCLFIILYGLYNRREDSHKVVRDNVKISGIRKILFCMLLSLILFLYSVPLVFNLRLSEGVAIVQ